MTYLDEVTSARFSTDKDGQVVFFPYAPLGAGGGYIVPPEQQQRLRRQENASSLCWPLLIFGVLTGASRFEVGVFFWTVAVLVMLALTWHRLSVRGLRFAPDRKPITQKLGFWPKAWYGAYYGSFIIAFWGVIGVLEHPTSSASWKVSLLLAVVFGIGAAASLVMLLVRRRPA